MFCVGDEFSALGERMHAELAGEGIPWFQHVEVACLIVWVGGCLGWAQADVKVDTETYAPLLKKCGSGRGRAGLGNQLQCEISLRFVGLNAESSLGVGNESGIGCGEGWYLSVRRGTSRICGG